ncbi:MAG: DNA-binding transcriptional regulator OxyR [Sphingomonas sp. 12-62-6]|nr:MAG: DNA-binding transcriptional regulator OxyR [Sphingomonas sp. 12-62-6]
MPAATITFKQLHYLNALAATGHFRRAAEQVGVTQPSLSAQIALLEERLGIRLVERGSTTAILTPRGRDIVERAQRILADVRALEESALDDPDGLSGTIRLGVSPTLGPYLMPHVVARLHRDHRALRLHVREGSPEDLLRDLAIGKHDAALIQLPTGREDFIVERLFREELLVAMAADDPLNAKRVIEPGDMAGRGLLTLSPQYRMSDQIFSLANAVQAVVMRDYEGTSLDAIRQMAGMGMGFALLPSLYIRSEIREGDDVIVRAIRGRPMYRDVGMVWRKRAGSGTAYQRLAQIVSEVEKAIPPIG